VGVWYKPGGRLNGAEIAALMTDMLLAGVAAPQRVGVLQP
jgi:hypothetical protein